PSLGPGRNRRRGRTRGGRCQATPRPGSSMRMLVRAPPVEAKQDGSIRIQDLTKVVMARRRLGLAEERLVPFEAVGNVAYADDRPPCILLAHLEGGEWLALLLRVATLHARVVGSANLYLFDRATRGRWPGSLQRMVKCCG